jgi:shikimate dehydrogenase
LPVQSLPFPQGDPKFLTGLAGRDILASRSPWMHEREADAQGIRLIYTLFDFNARQWDDVRLPELLESAERVGFAGLNVTFPFKQAVIPFLDDMSDAARRIGAVNTVSFAGGKRTGHNTDVSGFAESFRNGLSGAALKHVVQIGCGGAGSATAHALMECGVTKLALFDQDEAKRQSLTAKLQQTFGADRIDIETSLQSAIARADGVVNATPMGMASFPGTPLPLDLIDLRHWVADIVYFPLETSLLRDATLKGCRILDGSGMAVHQAAAAFEIFTGRTVDRRNMLKNFVEFVSGSSTRAA